MIPTARRLAGTLALQFEKIFAGRWGASFWRWLSRQRPREPIQYPCGVCKQGRLHHQPLVICRLPPGGASVPACAASRRGWLPIPRDDARLVPRAESLLRDWRGGLVAVFGLMAAVAVPSHAQELFMSSGDVIPEELESAYVKGLGYLATAQTAEGNWRDSYAAQPGVVGLAVVAMLAHGDDPNFGPYSAPIRKGLAFILGNANKTSGYIGSSMYNHGFATLALAEAYGAVDDGRIGPALQRAVELIVTSQAHNSQGAWRYSPESDDADTTVSGAQMVALFAARNAGIAVPDEAIEKGIKFYARSEAPGGGFGYTNPSGPNNPRTAIGALVFALAKRKDVDTFKAAMAFLDKEPARDDGYPFYYHYYAAQAFFHASVESWTAWNHRNMKQIIQMQAADGSWEGAHGTVFSTSTALLSLALNYRFLPIYER